ncbi:MAG: hypothetical protein ACP5I3_11990, partial [Thermoproteus sp.]
MRATAVLLVIAVAALAAASVIVSEGGDVIYFSTGSSFGAMDPLGNILWKVNAPALIASDRMGSCLAAAYRTVVANGTNATAVTAVALYVRGMPVWSYTLRWNATALATDCNVVAVANSSGYIYVLRNGRVVNVMYANATVVFLLVENGAVRYGVWRPGYVEAPLYGNHTAALYKSDRPYIIVDGAKYVGYGDMYGLTPPAAVSENGVLAFATYDTLYWGGKWIPIRPGAAVLAISGDGRVVAVGYLDKVYVYYDGRLAAEIPAHPRSVALDYDGLVMAVQDDAGIHPYIFEVVNATVLGCPYGMLRAGAAVYNVTGSTAVFVPKGQPLVPLTVNGSGWICVPQQQIGNTFLYKMYYTVRVVPPAAGPSLAAGPTAYSAPLTARVPSNIGDIEARLAGWLVGNRTYPPLATLVVDVEGPTAVAPLYELEIPNSTVIGQTKMVLAGYTAYGPNGMPLAPYKGNVFIGLIAYVYAQYVNYSLLYVYSLTSSGAPNATSMWLAPGATAYI